MLGKYSFERRCNLGNEISSFEVTGEPTNIKEVDRIGQSSSSSSSSNSSSSSSSSSTNSSS
jgi:hypothetical protein